MIYIEKSRRRRGAAIELAIMVLLLFSAFSVALVSVSLMLHKRQTNDAGELAERVKLDGIAERFIAVVTDNGDVNAWCDTVTDYDVAVTEKEDDGSLIMTLTVEKDEVILLTLELRCDGNVFTVTKWSYE